MNTAASLLSNLADTPEPFSLAIVAAVGITGCDLDLGGTILPDVPCCSSYAGRAAGDRVLVVNIRSGRIILGVVNAPDPELS